MDAIQIIKMGKVAVRNNATAYSFYQNLFKEAFGFTPECPTCGSINGHKHWQHFEAYAKGAEPLSLINNTLKNMSKKSFEVKNKSKIYSYTFEKNGRLLIARSYGDVMSEDFAKKYLETAKNDPELLQKRRSEFTKLPAGWADDETDVTNANDYPEKLADKKILALEKGYPESEYKAIKSNADMVAYLDKKAAEAAGAEAAGAEAAGAEAAGAEAAGAEAAGAEAAGAEDLS